MSTGYHKLKIKMSDIPKSKFMTCYEHYVFTFMPPGYTNAPMVFIDLLNRVFHQCSDKFVIMFINDILMYSRDSQQLKNHLRIILETLRKEKLYTKFKKYEFWLDQIGILGHISQGY